MTAQSTLDNLTRSEFFKELSEDQLQHLSTLAREVEFPALHTIFHQHDPGKDVYLIVHGRVSLAVCAGSVGCREIMELSDGDLMCWSPLLGRPRLSDSAKTLTATNAIAFDAEELLDVCKQNPDFGFEFMRRTAKVLAERLSATRMRLLDAHGSHLPDVAIESD